MPFPTTAPNSNATISHTASRLVPIRLRDATPHASAMPNHEPSSPGKAALRKGRHSEPGRIYLVTFTTLERAPVFANPDIACVASRAAHAKDLWADASLLRWVLMPDHWHGLIELGGTASLSELIGRLKARVTREVNACCGMHGSLWAEGFHDHALRSDEDLLSIARYIVLNPVRAGLSAGVGSYPFWDAVWLESGRD